MDKLNISIQIATLATVVAGVALVVYELREARLMSQAQLASDAFALYQTRQLATVGEDLAQTLGRACFEPESLTPEDGFVLNDFFNAHWNGVFRLARMELFDFDVPASTRAQATLETILSFPSGETWYRLNKGLFSDEFQRSAEKIISNKSRMTCDQYINQLTGKTLP